MFHAFHWQIKKIGNKKNNNNARHTAPILKYLEILIKYWLMSNLSFYSQFNVDCPEARPPHGNYPRH